MKHLIGFSTGALALGDWRAGLRQCREWKMKAVEVSALRFEEYYAAVKGVDMEDLSSFDYISFHLPSAYPSEDEPSISVAAEKIAEKGWPMILHPDAVFDWNLWRRFGPLLCIENMDKRKGIGRTVEELQHCFDKLPEASFCFDFGHARQVDPTMSHAYRILEEFRGRVKQYHFSDVDSSNRHRQLNFPALSAFSHLGHLCDTSIPFILETFVKDGGVQLQIQLTECFLDLLNGKVGVQPLCAAGWEKDLHAFSF